MNYAYLLYHVIFTVPILCILYYLQEDLGTKRNRRRLQSICILILIAYMYSVPWDNIMISLEVWEYSDIVLVTIWYAPLGEYIFFGIQTIIIGLYLYYIDFNPSHRKSDLQLQNRILGSIFFILIAFIALYFIVFGSSSLLYLSSITLWTAPVLALQWIVGGNYLLRNLRVIVSTVVPVSVYLWTIDAIAIWFDLWIISTEYTTDIKLGILPIEEMLFFTCANLMTVIGIILYEWVLEVWSNGSGIYTNNMTKLEVEIYSLLS